MDSPFMGNFMVKWPTWDRLQVGQLAYLQQESLSDICSLSSISRSISVPFLPHSWQLVGLSLPATCAGGTGGGRHIFSFTTTAASCPPHSTVTALGQRGRLVHCRVTIYIAPLSQRVSYRSVLRASFSCLFSITLHLLLSQNIIWSSCLADGLKRFFCVKQEKTKWLLVLSIKLSPVLVQQETMGEGFRQVERGCIHVCAAFVPPLARQAGATPKSDLPQASRAASPQAPACPQQYHRNPLPNG